MPWGDGTGPGGMGPMTGRGAGYCTGYGVPGYANPVGGRGYGFGFGRGGRGWGRGWGVGADWRRPMAGYAPTWGYAGWAPAAPAMPTREQQADMLRNQVEYLEEQLTGLRKRLSELESE